MAVNLRDIYYLTQNAEKYYWASTGFCLGLGTGQWAMGRGTSMLRMGRNMASFGIRAHVNALRAVATTPFRAGSTTTASSLVVGAIAGYALGATVGTAISHVAFGDKGRDLAADLYLPGGASFIEEGLLNAPSNAKKILDHYL